MKLIAVFAFLLSAAPAFAIVGGHPVTPQDRALGSLVQVVLWDDVSNTGSSCTGTIVAKDLVVTAAHCVFPDLDSFIAGKGNGGLNASTTKYYIYRGNMPLGWNKGRKIIPLFGKGRGWMPVKSVHVPPFFGASDGSHYNSDVALIQVDAAAARVPYTTTPVLGTLNPMQFQQLVRVIGAGPVDDEETKHFGHIFRTLGAFLSYPLDSATNTQEVVYVNDEGLSSDCTNQYIGLDFGDSGGPALITINDREYIWGVDSQGSTYTVLPLVRNWMNDVAAQIGSAARF